MKTKTRKALKPTRRAGQKPPLTRWLDQVAAQNVLIADRPKVLAYCQRYPKLASFLPQIAARVREFFGPDVGLVLERYQDPEIDDRYLSMHVRTPYAPDLIDRIEQVSAEFHYRWEPDEGHFLLSY